MAIREIIFRGKRVDNGEWVYGYCVYEVSKNAHWIFTNSLGAINAGFKPKRNDYCLINVEVVFETIGQYTGLLDKNGTKIFEGDIVRMCAGEYCYGVWEYDSTFEVSDIRGVGLDFTNYEEIYVVGNIHEVTP